MFLCWRESYTGPQPVVVNKVADDGFDSILDSAQDVGICCDTVVHTDVTEYVQGMISVCRM